MNSFTHGSRTRAADAAPGRISLRAEDGDISSWVGPLDAAARAARENGVSKRVHGLVASQKNARPMRWSTTEQRDMMVLLELDPAVLSYETAPEMVRFAIDGRSREHVPAFRAATRRGPVMLDTFPARGGSDERRQRLVAALTEIYGARGVPYRACDAGQIRLEPRFGNARWIRSRSWHRPTEEEIFLVTGALTADDHRTIAALQADLPRVADVGAVVGAMAVARQLTLDLSAAKPTDMVVSMDPRGARR